MHAFAAVAAVGFSASVYAADPHVLYQSSADLITPSFRGNSATSSYFGWVGGGANTGFDPVVSDATLADELIVNPTPNLGTAPATWGLVQSNLTKDIISGTNGIYIYPGTAPISLTLTTSAPGGVTNTGFTTIIVQGRTAFGGFPAEVPFELGAVNGVSPEVLFATVAAGHGQFWAKYEIPGYLSSYDVPINFTFDSASLQRINVDTVWSASAYAPDVAIVPEPASLGLLAMGAVTLVRRRRRA